LKNNNIPIKKAGKILELIKNQPLILEEIELAVKNSILNRHEAI
jgi:hypothetical protein